MASSDNHDRDALLRQLRAYMSQTQHASQRTAIIEEVARQAYQHALEHGTLPEQAMTKRCLYTVKRTHDWARREGLRHTAQREKPARGA